MAVVIRLARGGTKKKPFYHVVVADKEKPRDGKFIERLGFYDPKLKDKGKRWNVNLDQVNSWIKKGAVPSETVGHLIKEAAKSK